MIKGFIVLCLFLFSACLFAAANVCPHAAPSSSTAFCSTFKTAATCYCTSNLPAGMCQDLEVLYKRMMSMFGTLERACAYQKDTSPQDCIDSWNCYRQGGVNSQGALCSSTGAKCKQ